MEELMDRFGRHTAKHLQDIVGEVHMSERFLQNPLAFELARLGMTGSSSRNGAGGSTIETLVPIPDRLSMRSAPPDCSANPCAVARPRPVPLPLGFVVKNGSAARAAISGAMPLPESSIVKTTWG